MILKFLMLLLIIGCPYVLTHSRGNSKTMDSLAKYKNVVNRRLKMNYPIKLI